MNKSRIDILQRLYDNQNQILPTMDELADNLKVTKTTIFYHIAWLVDYGYLNKPPYKARSITLTDRGLAFVKGELNSEQKT